MKNNGSRMPSCSRTFAPQALVPVHVGRTTVNLYTIISPGMHVEERAAPEVNDAHGWSRISLKLRIIFIGSVFVAVAAIIAVVLENVGRPKESYSSAVTTSTNSTTAPGTATNTVSATSTACLFFFRRQGAMSHIVICEHSPSSPCPPSRRRFGSNRVRPSSEMLNMTYWELRWLSPQMPRLSWLELRFIMIIQYRIQDTSKSTE